MTLTEILTIGGSAGSVASVLYLSAVKIARIEVKVDTMWAFQMRRAFSEVVEKGVGTANSPLTFTPEVQRYLDPIKDELHQWHASHPKLKDSEALLSIEAIFGDRLLTMVCIPCGFTHGACLILALAVARDTSVIDLDFSLPKIPFERAAVTQKLLP